VVALPRHLHVTASGSNGCDAGCVQLEEVLHPLGTGSSIFFVTSLHVQAMTVRQLMQLYTDILVELQRRGLVRTNNAPIGDLAEYAAVLAYGGKLAKNSEKSYDLTASMDAASK
jgi:hypothetical protein